MPYKIDYTKVVGIKVFLEHLSTRFFVGKLEQKDNTYIFSYDEKYLELKKALPLGQEFPLIQQYFKSHHIFPAFQERIPSKENPAYPDYCKEFDISSEEDNIFVLLATIGRQGPSSFIFEPIWGDTFSGKDLKRFRKALGLSTRDFGVSFGISQATIVRVENNKASGEEVLKFLEILYHFPEAAAYYVEKYGSALQSNLKAGIMSHFRGWNILSWEELEFSQHAAKELEEIPWALKMLETPAIKKALAYSPRSNQKDEQLTKRALFEIRFAYAIHAAGLEAEYEFKTGVGGSSVDFKIDDKKSKSVWLVELTSLEESSAVKENSFAQGNFSMFNSITTPGDEDNSPEVRDIIKAQRAILSKVAKEESVEPIKFPEIINKKEQAPQTYHVILVDMRGFLVGVSDGGDYMNILYGSERLPEQYKVRWINAETQKKEWIVGLFDQHHPDPRSRYLRERVHAVGFMKEKFEDDKIINNLQLFYNPRFFSSSEEIRKLWPLKKLYNLTPHN